MIGFGFSVWAMALQNGGPSLGPEIVPHPNFDSWTADNPDGWVVSGESAGIAEVTEASPGFRMFTDGTFIRAQILDAFVIGRTYRYEYVCSAAVAGNMQFRAGPLVNINAAGSFSDEFVAERTDVEMKRSGATDITITRLSIREVL